MLLALRRPNLTVYCVMAVKDHDKTSGDTWLSDLRDNGFAVIRKALTPEECHRIHVQGKEETRNLPHMSHSQTMWGLRQSKNLRRIFEALWETDDLLCSFDGMYMRDAGEKTSFTIDWHVDQDSRHGEGIQCAQGLLAIVPSNKDSGCTSFLKQSHLDHARLCRKYEDKTQAWEAFSVSKRDRIFKSRTEEVSPALEAGDFLIWDSRCLHRVCAPLSSRTHARVVAYVTMIPASKANARALRDRKRAYECGISTTHWPSYVCDRGEESRPLRKWSEASQDVKDLIMGKAPPRMCNRLLDGHR